MERNNKYYLGMVIKLSENVMESSDAIMCNILIKGKYNKEDVDDLIRLKARLKLYMKVLGFDEDEIKKSVADYQDMGIGLAFSKTVDKIDVKTMQEHVGGIGEGSLPEGMLKKAYEEIAKILKYININHKDQYRIH